MAKPAIDRAREALTRRAWHEAYGPLSAAGPDELTGSDLEGLADAAWWLSRFDESIDARQRAYATYAATGDDLGAAATAARLAIEHFVRGRSSIGAGFLHRAERHAKNVPDGPGHGFLAMVEANVARFGGDLEGSIALSEQALAIGERFGDPDLVSMALHVEGLAMIDAGRVAEGLARMDEAMVSVLAGDIDPYFTGIIYCGLISACLELHDVRRAGEWSDAAQLWCQTLRPDSPFPGMCAVNRAEVARLRGAWPQAELVATQAADQLVGIEPSLAGPAFVQLGEIRRRIGDVQGADAAFQRGLELGADPQPGFALLRLAQGKTGEALAQLRHAIAAEHQPARRARSLAAQVEVALAGGMIDQAQAAAIELEELAEDVGTPALVAMAAAAGGATRLESGDVQTAIERLRSAIASFHEIGLPYEEARTRVTYGRALRAAGDRSDADVELEAALAIMRGLGAGPDADDIERLLAGSDGLPAGLTAREAEVLRLVAAGMTNRDIAVELVISEHTVARHLQNMFAKLGVSTRAGATAFAFEHGLT